MGRKSEQSKNAYNNIAIEYDASKEGRYTRFHINELQATVDVKDGNVVLDVACGNGTLLGLLGQKAKIYGRGIDISDNMIAVARKRHPNMIFEAKPCYPLDVESDSIDVITVCCAFHHFENPQGFLNECKRVLKKNGVMYLADPNFGFLIRTIANYVVFLFSKSGDVRVYSQRELECFFDRSGFTMVRSYKKGQGIFVVARK